MLQNSKNQKRPTKQKVKKRRNRKKKRSKLKKKIKYGLWEIMALSPTN
jgi:hypothetical protein